MAEKPITVAMLISVLKRKPAVAIVVQGVCPSCEFIATEFASPRLPKEMVLTSQCPRCGDRVVLAAMMGEFK